MTGQLRVALALLALTAFVVVASVSSRSEPPTLPGVDDATLSPEVREELADRVAAPLRTRHLRADGRPLYTNRLVDSSSPYLQQHAHNPVNWFPWGEEAFELAARLNRPVFLSIGYATCHWCHVMEEESFEDPEIAALLNANYIAIKVDREARPDVDRIYLEAVRTLHGSGGWPANVWLTPDRRPFFAATYIPARDGDRGIRTGFVTFLTEIAATWRDRPSEVTDSAGRLTGLIRDKLVPAGVSGVLPADPRAGLESWVRERFDPEHGGRTGRLKFPHALPLRAMLGSPDPEIRGMAERTLLEMASGGIYDQVAGGYHRYATDPAWRVPHFEKTLLDNVQLARLHGEAFQRTGDLRHASVMDEVLTFLARDLGLRGGGWASALDADSGPDRVEGAHVTWTVEEVRAALTPERASAVEAAWGLVGEGPVDGRHVPAWTGIPSLEARRSLGRDRLDLLLARSRRPPPARDEKLLVGWNGLGVASFAYAGWLLGREDWLDEARLAAERLLEAREDGRLPRLIGARGPEGPGFLEDHVYVVDGLITLFEATGEPGWLTAAVELTDVTQAQFGRAGAYFATPHDAEALLVRDIPRVDQNAPGPNALHVGNLLRLAALTGQDRHRAEAEVIAADLALDTQPAAAGEAVLALTSRPLREIVLVAEPGERVGGLLAAVRTAPPASRVFVRTAEGDADVGSVVPATRGKLRVDGLPTVYVCYGGVCQAPVTDPAALAEVLTRP